MRVALIQFKADGNKEQNVRRALQFCETALKKESRCVLLPEVFNWRGDTRDAAALAAAAEFIPGPSVQPFLALAKKYRACILTGSILEKTRKPGFYNTSVFINGRGTIVAKYRKIHLFDARLGAKIIRESSYMKAGRFPVMADMDGFKTGLSICYDLRFTELYRLYSARGARVLAVPSCFTKKTGQSHWEVLLRARAVENLAYVLAPNQVGANAQGVEAFGNSMIISPWGEVIARGSSDKEEIVYGDIDMKRVIEARRVLPGIVPIQEKI